MVHYHEIPKFDKDIIDRKYVDNAQQPFLLEHLKPNTEYEVYVKAVNEHGPGDESARIIFKTKSEAVQAVVETTVNTYNVSQCCSHAGMDEECLPLCSYDASMSELNRLSSKCGKYFNTLLRCVTAGRNHVGCCERRGVHENCLSLCAGTMTTGNVKNPNFCMPFIGNMIQCFEEGKGNAFLLDSYSP